MALVLWPGRRGLPVYPEMRWRRLRRGQGLSRLRRPGEIVRPLALLAVLGTGAAVTWDMGLDDLDRLGTGAVSTMWQQVIPVRSLAEAAYEAALAQLTVRTPDAPSETWAGSVSGAADAIPAAAFTGSVPPVPADSSAEIVPAHPAYSAASIAGPLTLPDAPVPHYHVVAGGETLLQIAHRYDTTVAQLVQLNQLADPDNIIQGARLVISR